MNKITVSAPGKIHLLGEHFVVYGAPALLATVDLRCTIQLTPHRNHTIEIISPSLNIKAKLTINQLLAKRARAESDWKQFSETNNISLLSKITAAPLDHAAIAIAEAFHYYQQKPSTGFSIQIESQIPINAGLGSSSAISVALAAAVTLFLRHKFDQEVINNIAYEAEKRRHGNPSGADNATITYGSIIRFIRNPKTIEPLNIKIPKKLADNFVIIETGKPAQSTGEMVALVKDFRQKNPNLFETAFQSQSQLADNLIPVIKSGDGQEFMKIIKQGERNLETIGTVSEFSQKIIRDIETAGGAAKMCGAGSTAGPTGIILGFHPDKTKVERIAKSYNLPFFTTALGVEGVKI